MSNKSSYEVFGFKKPETPLITEIDHPEIPEGLDETENNKDVDWQAEVWGSESIADLIHNLEWAEDIDGQNGNELMEKLETANDFLKDNMEDIVEGVLNSSEDVGDEQYVDGSNSDVRNKLGRLVKSLGNQKLEELARKLMKQEMEKYFTANKLSLAEKAIAQSPSVASLLEVVKRFKQIKDGAKTYDKAELEGLVKANLELDHELDVYADKHKTQTAIDSTVFDSLREAIKSRTDSMPEKLGIRSELSKRLYAKLGQVKEKDSQVKEKELKTYIKAVSSSSDDGVPKKSGGFFSRVKGWFGRK